MLNFTVMGASLTEEFGGTVDFFLDESGVLRARHGQAAGPQDPPVE